jgi:hypothetical protein
MGNLMLRLGVPHWFSYFGRLLTVFAGFASSIKSEPEPLFRSFTTFPYKYPFFARASYVVCSMKIFLSVFPDLLKRGQRKQKPIHRVFVTRRDI